MQSQDEALIGRKLHAALLTEQLEPLF